VRQHHAYDGVPDGGQENHPDLSSAEHKTGSGRATAWFKQAGFDLEAARLSLDHGYFERTAFQSQQAAEKSLKGLLVLLDGYAPKGHRLGGLLGFANHLDRRVREHIQVSIASLEAATFVSRYPFAIPAERMSPHEFTLKEDAEACLQEANDLYNQIKHFVTNSMQQSIDW
jgi:HEPN domain-containing protein